MNENNLKDQFNRDENDEMTDEEYFADDAEQKEETGNMDDMVPQEDSITIQNDDEYASGEDEDYHVTNISETFLKTECSIKNESAKTELKFEYRGENYKGVCMQKLPTGRWNYVFLVQTLGRGKKATGDKKLKKICVQEVNLL